MTTDFAEPKWAVTGYIPEGVTLLAGPPKVGKSWMALGFAVAVSSGGLALSKVSVTEGDVLYLALEDTPRRLKRRLGQVLAGAEPPPRLTISVACPSITEGGLNKIDQWLADHPSARLVVIDVLARLRGPVPQGMNKYDADYGVVARFKEIADRHAVAIVLVHHTRKQTDDDFLQEVSGTNGLAGAADAVLVLRRSRGNADGELHVTGRDVDEISSALKFAKDLGAWQLLAGPALENTLPKTRAEIVKYLRGHEGATPRQIADYTGFTYENVKQTVGRMVAKAELDTDGAGHYFVSIPVDDIGDPPGTAAVTALPVTAVTAVTLPGQSGDSPVTAAPESSQVSP